MDQDSISKKAPPVQQTSPEEDATLLAIEALEAQSIDLDTPAVQPAPAPVAPPQPVVVQPTPAPVAPTPIPTPKPAPTPAKPLPPATPLPPVRTAPVAAPTPAPAPEKPQTLSEKINEAISSDTPAPTKRFQFFINQKPPRKPFVIGGIVAIAVGLGVAAYLTLL